MTIRVIAVLAFLFCCSTSFAEEPVEIPLDQIWANSMPGTKKFSELNTQEPLVPEIREAIGFTQKNKDAKPAFAVLGTGLDALREAHEVLVNKKKPRDTFPPGSEVSVVFFAHETEPYVHLHKVERQDNSVNINYRFVYHEEQDTNRYFALLPLGKLPSGRYDVNVVRAKKYERKEFPQPSDEVARRIVCGAFLFTISEQGE